MSGSKVTPFQLLHSRKSPFLNILTISAFFHIFGHFLALHNLLLNLVSLLAVTSISVFSSSGPNSSTAAFPSFVLFGVFLVSCTRHRHTSMSSTSSTSSNPSSSTGFAGSSLCITSLKRSAHLCGFSRGSVLSTTCLSFTPAVCLTRSPVIFLVMLYSSLLLPFSTAFSAAFLRPFLALLFTSLSSALNSSELLCFNRSDLVLPIFSFSSFLSSTFFHDSSHIHDFLCSFSVYLRGLIVFFLCVIYVC